MDYKNDSKNQIEKNLRIFRFFANFALSRWLPIEGV